ncbi:MAG: 5-aminolevulinate synthase [Proteobacteria bacterium]|nr:5-aminolevulinate synthase [Pseudomonadota bacterium]
MPIDIQGSFYAKIFDKAISLLKDQGNYRYFNQLTHYPSFLPVAHNSALGRDVVIWCSNDYLRMSKHPTVINAMINCVKRYGVGSGGTRNISGTNDIVTALEKRVATLHEKESALIFTSGYVANQGALAALGKIMPNCIVFSDSNNHASIINGIKESKLTKEIFRHNDMEDLEMLLKKYDKDLPKIIVFESVYSMTGDIAHVETICNLAEKYNALTYIDEVHSVGLYGKGGAGISNEKGVHHRINIIQGTFAKAFGVIGGYIAGNANIIDAVRSFAPSFIFTTTLPPGVLAAAISSLEIVNAADDLRLQYKNTIENLKRSLREYSIIFQDEGTHIIPIIIGDAFKARTIAENLMQSGIYIQCINFPTVPRGKEMLRITLSPYHTDQMIEHLSIALSKNLHQ